MKKRFAFVFVAIILCMGNDGGFAHPNNSDKSQIKSTVIQFMNMKAFFDNILKEEGVKAAVADFSRMDQNDEYVSGRLLEAYRKILTGSLLKEYEDRIKGFSLYSCKYEMFYADLRKFRIKKISMKRDGSGKYVCTLFFDSNEEYPTNLFTPNLDSLIADYKVSNYPHQTGDELQNCDVIYLNAERKNIFYLLKEGNKWLIYDIDWEIERSRLRMLDYDSLK